MNQFAKTFTLSACALAASVLISACGGGGGATDTTPPTVAISSADGTAGAVTFTFTFSEAVKAGTFAVEDIAVTGGTPGALTMVDDMHYTLSVVPTTGAISASVAASKFSDVANNVNTASATTTYSPVAMDFSAANISFNSFEGLISAGIADDPVTGASNKVAKFVKGPTGMPWAGATIYTYGSINPDPTVHSQLSVDAVDLSGSKVITLRSYTAAPIGTVITLKLENAANPGENIAAEARTTTQNAWETLSFNFATTSTGVYSASTVYNTVSVFPAFSIPATGSVAPVANTTFYFDDLVYTKAAGGGGTPVPATAPTVAAAAPTALAANVISIYSDAYTNIVGTDFFPAWGQSSVVSDAPVAGNATKKVSNLNYQGIALAAPVDVSGMSNLHLDVWSQAAATLNIGIVTSAAASGAAALETQVPKTLVTGWNSIDIPLASFTAPNLVKIDQFVLVGTGTIFYDNIYFSKAAGGGAVACGTTEPTCAPTTVIPSGAVTVYSEASATAGFNAFPGWGQTTQYSEVTLAGNKSLKYSNLNYEGIEFTAVDVSAKGQLRLDVWSATAGTLNVGIITSAASNPTGALETQVPKTLVAGWNTLEIPLTSFTKPNLAKIDQLILVGSGTIFVDNIHFLGTGSAPSGGGSTPNPAAEMGSGGAVTIPVATVADAFGFVAVGDAVFASDYVGAIDSNNNHASWTNAVTSGNGNIGYFNDPAMDNAVQKLDANGWIGSGLDNPGGVPNFFRYFVFTGTAAPFANSYMGLFANSPNNGLVNVSTYGNIKLKLWGPAEMYQQGNLNPTVELILTGSKVSGCTATGSGGTEISKTFSASQKIGAGSTYKIPLAAWTVKGVCGTDTPATAVAAVLGGLARVVVNVPGSSFNFTNASANSNPAAFATGVNLGPIAFSVN